MQCPKCQSTDVIDDVRVVDHGDHHAVRDLTVTVFRKPTALMFKGTVYSDVKARVCGACGFIELFAVDAAGLLEGARERAQHE